MVKKYKKILYAEHAMKKHQFVYRTNWCFFMARPKRFELPTFRIGI